MVIGFITRKAIGIIILLLMLAVATVFGLGAVLGSVAEAGVRALGPVITRVPVQVADIDLSLLGGSIAVQGFGLGNPDGFESENSIYVETSRVRARLRTLLSDTVVLESIVVERPRVTAEFMGGTLNLAAILKQMPKPDERKTQRKFRIGELHIRQPQVRLAGLPLGQSVEFSLPDIQMEDLDTGGEGRTPEEIVAQVLRLLQERVLGRLDDVLSEEQLNQVQGQLEQVIQEGTDVIRKRLDGLLP